MMKQEAVTDDLDALLRSLPPRICNAIRALPDSTSLLEIVLDLGREPEARFTGREVILSDEVVSEKDIDYIVEHIGSFGDDNRAGIERTLHRISAIRNRKGKIVGLTCRIGRAVFGTIAIIRDIVEEGKSILILGRPGVGKTTMLREVARVLADELKKRVIVVDTSNEIAGDGDIPHPGIGRARRMQVSTPNFQHAVMIEAVENHMPEVIVIDEIGTELEAAAARTIAERGVQLVGTAHGNTLDNLMMNPTLSDLLGGIQTVTLGDEEARRRGTQKSILERKAPPTFDVIVELQNWQHLIVHRDVAETIDGILRGDAPLAEERTRKDSGEMTIHSIVTSSPETAAPPWSPDRALHLALPLRHQRPGGRRSPNLAAVPARSPLAAEEASEAPIGVRLPLGIARREAGMVGTNEANGNVVRNGQEQEAPVPLSVNFRTLHIYPFGISRSRLEQSARELSLPILISHDQHEADAIITLKNAYRSQPEALRLAEERGKPIYVLKNNTVAQMQTCLAGIFGFDKQTPAADSTMMALQETEDAINHVLTKGASTVELTPQNSYIRRLQHQLADRYNLVSKSRGKEPNRRVKIFNELHE